MQDPDTVFRPEPFATSTPESHSDQRQPVQPSSPPSSGGSPSGSTGQPLASEILRTSSHPMACIFHLAFKAGAIIAFLWGLIFASGLILPLVIQLSLLVFDFYTVKNITGRLLVGLRYFSVWDDETGKQRWEFESLEDKAAISSADSNVFWITLWVWPIIWIPLLLLGFFFGFSQIIIVIVAICLAVSNCVGFVRCSRSQQEKIKGMVTRTTAGVISSQLRSGVDAARQ